MLRILALTDFSENANNALRNALKLARYYSAEVVFMHVMTKPMVPATSPEEVFSGVYLTEKEKHHHRLLSEVTALYHELGLRHSEIPKQVVIENGPVADAMLQVINRNKISLVMAGHSAPNGLKRLLLGSTTYNLSRICPVPLLIIPPAFDFSGFKNIAVVVSLKQFGYRPGFKLLARFAFTFSSTIHLLVFYEQDESVPELAELLNPKSLQDDMQDIPYEIIPFLKESEEEKLRNQLTRNNYDMLVWLPKPTAWWGDLFTETYSEEIAHEAKIPLLIIPHLAEEKNG